MRKPPSSKEQAPPYTVAQAAMAFGVTGATIYNWLRKGILAPAPVQGGIRLITAESVERYIERKEAQSCKKS